MKRMDGMSLLDSPDAWCQRNRGVASGQCRIGSSQHSAKNILSYFCDCLILTALKRSASPTAHTISEIELRSNVVGLHVPVSGSQNVFDRFSVSTALVAYVIWRFQPSDQIRWIL